MKALLLAILFAFTSATRSEDTFETVRESVRGDTGKWNDNATLQHTPSPAAKPADRSLDDWAAHLADTPTPASSADDNWLIFRSRQLDDNDRIRIGKIERQGNTFTIVMNEAIWQGYYNKTFTYYEVIALNLGKLPVGEYTVKWVVRPGEFSLFDGDGKPQSRNGKPALNWPKDEKTGSGEPVELKLAFSVR